MENPHALKHKELSPGDLRWKCDPGIFDFDSTENVDPVEGIVGQERALDAIKLGVDMKSPGYNIYIAVLSGTGKATTVKKMLESISTNCPDRKSTRLNSSHLGISYAVFCLKKKILY